MQENDIVDEPHPVKKNGCKGLAVDRNGSCLVLLIDLKRCRSCVGSSYGRCLVMDELVRSMASNIKSVSSVVGGTVAPLMDVTVEIAGVEPVKMVLRGSNMARALLSKYGDDDKAVVKISRMILDGVEYVFGKLEYFLVEARAFLYSILIGGEAYSRYRDKIREAISKEGNLLTRINNSLAVLTQAAVDRMKRLKEEKEGCDTVEDFNPKSCQEMYNEYMEEKYKRDLQDSMSFFN